MTEAVTTAAAGAEGGAAGGAAGGGAATGATTTWTDSITDTGLRDWAVNKGYNKLAAADAPVEVARQYHHLEKLFGADRAGKTVEIPDFEKADDAAKAAFFDRVGRPKESKEYDLSLPKEGVIDKEFEGWARENFHKAGITSKQASVLGKAWSDFAVAQNAKQGVADQQRYADEDKALKTEWGAKYDDNIKVASAAAKSFGVDPKAIDALQKVAGYGAAMKMFASIAEKIGEAQFISGEGAGTGGTMTPAEATAAIKAHQADKDWMASFLDKRHAKHADAIARMAFLSTMQVGGTAS